MEMPIEDGITEEKSTHEETNSKHETHEDHSSENCASSFIEERTSVLQ